MEFVLRLLPRSKLYLVLIGLVCVIILMYRYQHYVEHKGVAYVLKKKRTIARDMPRPLDDVLLAERQPKPGRSIFFLETTRVIRKNAEMKHNMLQLLTRQACAIESAALHNPNFDVFVLFSGPIYRYTDHSDSQQLSPIIKAILSYKNVYIRQLNMQRFAEGTPIEEWVKQGKLENSSYAPNHFSDLLRLLTLYRYGGIYCDLDVILLRSMENVTLNYAAAESKLHVANGVMAMAPTGFGHKFAESCLVDFQQNFRGNSWGHNGPGVITRLVKKTCGTSNISTILNDRKRCHGFMVFDSKLFYAITYAQWRYFFLPNRRQETLNRTKDSFLVHLWNKVSQHEKLKVGSESAYDKFAGDNCPKAYAAAGLYF